MKWIKPFLKTLIGRELYIFMTYLSNKTITNIYKYMSEVELELEDGVLNSI
jgi:hypothetical protein